MTPLELYRAGELREAIKALGEELRKSPLDAKRRTFLFELLCFAGEYDRAEKQLDVLAAQSPKAIPGMMLYRSAIHAERTRQEMFAKGETPKVEDGVQSGGSWNGKPFEEMSDADPRIGANLEVFIAGSYTWIPMHYLRGLEVEAPTNLRDLLWARARVEASPEFRLQELGEVLLPVISPLSSGYADNAVQLGRETAWEEDAVHGQIPYGAKMMMIDGVDVPLLELRSVEWTPGPGEESGAEESDGKGSDVKESGDASA
jgi:type VI secretion system protein ImpE